MTSNKWIPIKTIDCFELKTGDIVADINPVNGKLKSYITAFLFSHFEDDYLNKEHKLMCFKIIDENNNEYNYTSDGYVKIFCTIRDWTLIKRNGGDGTGRVVENDGKPISVIGKVKEVDEELMNAIITNN